MKIRILFTISIGIGAIGIFMSMANGPSSSGAPPAHTGAPGEKTCATIGCHDDNGINEGTAKVQFSIGSVSNYAPKKTYPITVSISDFQITRFGFQAVAISELTGKSLGTFIITDSERTQLTSNTNKFPDREYITYAFGGTDAVTPGNGEWTFNWKSPSQNLGPVRFYVSAVSANDNENDKGDFVYTSSWLINDSK
jgi:hypothetical protein